MRVDVRTSSTPLHWPENVDQNNGRFRAATACPAGLPGVDSENGTVSYYRPSALAPENQLLHFVKALTYALALVLAASAYSDDCKHTQTQTDLNECLAQDAQRLSEVAAKLDQEIAAKYSGAGRAEALALHDQWLAYRERECRWEASLFEGGSIKATIYAGCLVHLTRDRIERRRILLCEGAPMTGECEESRAYANEM